VPLASIPPVQKRLYNVGHLDDERDSAHLTEDPDPTRAQSLRVPARLARAEHQHSPALLHSDGGPQTEDRRDARFRTLLQQPT